jgi:hypothetical protein
MPTGQQQLEQFARRLKPLFGSEWRLETQDERVSLSRADGASILFLRPYNGRCEVWGKLPEFNGQTFLRGNEKRTTITVSIERDYIAVFRDIYRRFLQPYLALYLAVSARIASARGVEDERRRIAADLARKCSESVHPDGFSFSGEIEDGPRWISVEVRSDTDVHITLACSADQARAIAMFLARMKRRN